MSEVHKVRPLFTAGVTWSKPRPAVKVGTLPEEDGWEGEFVGETGSCRHTAFHALLALRIGNGLVAGLGCTSNFPSGKHESRDFEVSGSIVGLTVEFDIHHSATFLDGMPFACLGEADPEIGTIQGRFEIGCFTGCGCGGGTGTFVLRRERA